MKKHQIIQFLMFFYLYIVYMKLSDRDLNAAMNIKNEGKRIVGMSCPN